MSPTDPDQAREALAGIIHDAERNAWPEVSADPQGGCLGMDRCRFVAARLLDPANRDAVLRALGLREDYMGFSVEDGEPTYKRYVTRWEDVTDE